MIDRMSLVQTKRCGPASEGATRHPCATLAEAVPPRHQRDLQGRPFLSPTKAKGGTPILKYPAASRRISQARYRRHRTYDVLIRASAKSSCHTSADCQSRVFRLIAIGRTTDNCECKFFRRARARLTSAVMRVTIRPLKLAIEFADFAPSGSTEPWPGRVAQNDTAGQQQGYRFAHRRLHGESASLGGRPPKILPDPPRGRTHETRAISFASPPTQSPGRRRSSAPSSLTELLWRCEVPIENPHPAGSQHSQGLTILRSSIQEQRWECV
jgi:hypothetical protein